MEDPSHEALVDSLPGLDGLPDLDSLPGLDGLPAPLTDVLADPTAGSNAMAFLLVAGLGLGMALIYVPLRLFLTITARSRRLQLLQRIRRLREELAQPVRP